MSRPHHGEKLRPPVPPPPPPYCYGSIVVVAKCPLPGRCKTRLSALLGRDGSAALARAMLSDVLTSLSRCAALRNVSKILLHAPGNELGASHMMELLESLHLPYHAPSFRRLLIGGEDANIDTNNGGVGSNFASSEEREEEDEDDDDDETGGVDGLFFSRWHLLPILEEEAQSEREMLRSDLGTKLADALERARTLSARRRRRSALRRGGGRCGGGSGGGRDGDDDGRVKAAEMSNNRNWSVSSVASESSSGGGGGGALDSFLPGIVGSGPAHATLDDDDGGPVLFLGMDSPELPLDEIAYALTLASSSASLFSSSSAAAEEEGGGGGRKGKGKGSAYAYLCPADDGGYGMLCLPSSAPPSVFRGVRWSNRLTAISQLKALSDVDVAIKIGTEMHDVDEPYDVRDLAVRLCLCRRLSRRRRRREEEEEGKKKRHSSSRSSRACPDEDVLKRPPPPLLESAVPFDNGGNDDEMLCRTSHTWEALVGLGLILEDRGSYSVNEERWRELDL